MREKIGISILGDICPTEDWQVYFSSGIADNLWGHDAQDLVEETNCFIANLECPVTSSVNKITKCGPNQKAIPEDLIVLKKMGVTAVSLANNHINDFGARGILDTFAELDKHGIAWFGAGKNSTNFKSVYYMSAGSEKIGFASFAEEEFNLASDKEAGALGFDPYVSSELIAEWKSKCDHLVILYHGGIEHYSYPSPELQKKCRLMVRSGADVVVCQHSHCIGTYEFYKNGYIQYGQGNGLFGYRKNFSSWNEGLLLRISFDKKPIVDYTLLQATPEGLKINKDMTRIERMHQQSLRICDAEFITKSWIEFCRTQANLDLPLLMGWPKNMIRLNRICRGKLLRLLVSRFGRMASMNFLRCDSLREVVTTCLEENL